MSVSIHTVIAPVAASGIGPYVADPPTTLLIDVGAHLAEITAETLDDAHLQAQEIVTQAEAEARKVLEGAQDAVDKLSAQAETALAEAGEEAASILDKAGAEAEDVAARAAEEVEEIKAAARADAVELKSAAAAEVDDLLTAARAEADQILVTARAEADDIRKQAEHEVVEQNAAAAAHAEAVAVLEDARHRAAELLADAQASAEQIVATAREDAQLEASRIREAAEVDALSSTDSVDEKIADIQAIHQIELATLTEREERLKARIADLEAQSSSEIGPSTNGRSAQGQAKAPEPSRNGGGRKARNVKASVEEPPKRSPWLIPDEDEQAPTVDAVSLPESESNTDEVPTEEPVDEVPATLFESTGELRPAETLIEPLRPAAFRAGVTDKKRKRRR